MDQSVTESSHYCDLAMPALIDCPDSSWAVAVDSCDGSSLLEARCKDYKTPYPFDDKFIQPPFRRGKIQQYWIGKNTHANLGVNFASCYGHVLYDTAGEAIRYVLAKDMEIMANDFTSVLFFSLIADHISIHMT